MLCPPHIGFQEQSKKHRVPKPHFPPSPANQKDISEGEGRPEDGTNHQCGGRPSPSRQRPDRKTPASETPARPAIALEIWSRMFPLSAGLISLFPDGAAPDSCARGLYFPSSAANRSNRGTLFPTPWALRLLSFHSARWVTTHILCFGFPGFSNNSWARAAKRFYLPTPSPKRRHPRFTSLFPSSPSCGGLWGLIFSSRSNGGSAFGLVVSGFRECPIPSQVIWGPPPLFGGVPGPHESRLGRALPMALADVSAGPAFLWKPIVESSANKTFP